tara:strand:+ start:881 stop:1630 length:750 start_codon:yes stop_codon:yes gene_type:complete
METIIYKGIEIEISNDSNSGINPFKDWDYCVPLIYDGGRRWGEDYSNGQILDYLRNYLTYNQVKRHQTRILKMIGFDVEAEKEYAKADEIDLTERIQDDYLYTFLDEGIENMEAFCIEFDIKHYRGDSRGYTQGDYADVFMCWTPEFEKITGRDYKSMDETDFKSGFDLFTNWAWGDIYVCNIEETGDSCGEFYGTDHKESGLLKYAETFIDCYIKSEKKKRFNKLKELIKSKVSLLYRYEQINQFKLV